MSVYLYEDRLTKELSKTNNISIKEFLPSILNKLLRDSSFFLHGESLAEIIFNKEKPYRYELAFFGNFSSILNILKIKDPDFLSFYKKFKKKNIEIQYLNLYFKENEFFFLKREYPDHDIPDFYIQLSFFETKEDFYLKKSKNSLKLSKLFYDGDNLYYLGSIDNFEDKSFYFSLDKKEEKIIFSSHISAISFLRQSFLLNFPLVWQEAFSQEINSSYQKDQKLYKKAFKNEFIKIFELEKPSLLLNFFRVHKILDIFLPELLEGYGMYQNEYHRYDVYYHCLKSCDAAEKKIPFLRIASLFHDIGKPRSCKEIEVSNLEEVKKNVFYNHENIGAKMTFYILKRLGFSLKVNQKITKLVRMHMFYYTNEWTDRATRRFLNAAADDLDLLFELRKADRLGSGTKKAYSNSLEKLKRRIEKIQKEDKELKVKDLKIKGQDLKDIFKLKEGPIIGKILKQLLEIVKEDLSKNNLETLKSQTQIWLENQKE